MEKQNQTFKMGKKWATRFVSPKKRNAGWKIAKVDESTDAVIKPDGQIFALHNTVTGDVHTTASITDVQW